MDVRIGTLFRAIYIREGTAIYWSSLATALDFRTAVNEAMGGDIGYRD